MAQEESPRWVQIQNKTFTKWVNSYMVKRNLKVENMVADFNDGIKLIQFLEILSNSSLGKYEKKVNMKIQKIQNLSTALNFLAKSGVRLLNIGAEDICDGSLKLILGLIWIIIQKFQIDDITEEEMTAKDALLLWCKKKTKGYKDCHIENFHTSWQDGMGLCALIHAHRPDLIDYSKLSKTNAAENVKLAFEVAEKHLGIPQLLDLEDLVNIPKPDERSVMTYIAQFYHVFSSARKQEIAGRRVGGLVDFISQLESMQNDYEDRAKKLVVWINGTTTKMVDRTTDGTVQDIKHKIQLLHIYKSDEKPPKAGEKTEIDALFTSIQLKLRTKGRPPYNPSSGLSPDEIDAIWEKLSYEEQERSEWLRRELARLQGVEILLKKFNEKAGNLHAWIEVKLDYLKAPEQVNSLAEAQTKLKLAEAFLAEFEASKKRLNQVEELSKQILILAPNATEVQTRTKKLESDLIALEPLYHVKLEDLKKKLAEQERIEELRKKFAAAAKEYMRFNKDSIGEVGDHNFGDDLETVEAARKKLDKSDKDITDSSNKQKDHLDQIWAELEDLNATSNPYTVITNKDIHAAQNRLLDEIKARRAAYEAELVRQKLMEEKRKEFAQKAQDFVDSLEQRRGDFDKSNNGEPDPNEAIKKVQHAFDENKPERHKLDALSNLQSEMVQLGIRDNPHTKWTLPLLKRENDKFVNHVKNIIQALKDEIELKEEYVKKAEALVEWAKATIPTLKKTFDNTLEGVRILYEDWNKYKSGESAEKNIDRSNLEQLFKKINLLLKNYNRPEYKLEHGLSLVEVNKVFDDLEHAEKEAEKEIRLELERQEKLYALIRRFNAEASDLEAFAKSKEDYFKASVEIKNLHDARLTAKLLDLHTEEVESKKKRLHNLEELSKEIENLHYKDTGVVKAKLSEINGIWEHLIVLAGEKRTIIVTSLKAEQEKENLRIQFADECRAFRIFVRSALEDIGDRYFGSTIEQVTDFKNELQQSDTDFKNKANELIAAINATHNSLQAAGVKDNRHTTITIDDVTKLHNQVLEALQKRQDAYHEEFLKQGQNEEKRKEWTKKSDDFVQFVNQLKTQLENVEGTPNERIEKINHLYNGGVEVLAKIKELDELAVEMENMGIFSNKHSKLTLNSIKSYQQQLDSSIKNFIAALKEEQAMNERAAGQRAELEKRQKIEDLNIRYSELQQELGVWLESAGDILTDEINVSSMEEVKKLQSDFDKLVAEIPHLKGRYSDLENLAGLLKQAGRDTTFNEFTERWNATLDGLDKRKEKLAEAAVTQASNEKLCREFANIATSFNKYIEDRARAAGSVTGELEDQLRALQDLTAGLQSKRSDLDIIIQLSNQMDSAYITSNPYTDLNMKTLKNKFESLLSTTSEREKQLNKDILASKGQNVSAEQIAEYKELFEYFDKNKNNKLSKLEFKGVLQTIGDDPTDEHMESLMKDLDNDHDGFITFEEFTNYMIAKSQGGDSSSQIAASLKDIANDKDFITEDDLRAAGMTTAQIQYLVKNMPQTKGGYDYNSWVKKI